MIIPDETFLKLPAREKESQMLFLAGEICLGLFKPTSAMEESSLRLAGYMADHAFGRSRDNHLYDENVSSVRRACHLLLEGLPVPLIESYDPLQVRWGSPCLMDYGKMRSELDVHILDLKRDHNIN